ncbi:MAG: zf-HC2 domain-containing protein [Gammaproteobacteria bacterium]|nr:zf-HC2 domain-containing protein [Gammaproteobacteria bacterium]MDH3429958.1 zf-HC2 domain-containing protein [Gammaproteobacteria bacterium]
MDPYLDGELEEALSREVESHHAECDACAAVRSRKVALRQTLKSIPVPPPEDGFLDAAVEETLINTHRNETRFRATAGIGSAIAAGIVAWLVFVLPADLPTQPEATIETVSITMNVEKTFRLTFDSKRELQAVAILVQLPDGVEIVGYEGRDSVRWKTTVKSGTNILELPIVVRSGNGGAILARLEHEGKQKTFEFAVKVI